MKLTILGKVCYIIIFLLLTSGKIFSQDKIQEAYSEINSGKFDEAEQIFLKESGKPDSYRADMGLFLLYEIKIDAGKAWQYYYKVINKADKPEPYIFAFMYDAMFSRNINDKNSGLLELLKKESENTEDGFENAEACERLGRYYSEHNDLKTAQSYYDRLGAVKDWSVIGPFENISASGYYQEYGPEKEFNTDKIYTGKNNKPVHWFNLDKIRRDYWIDFTLNFPTVNSIFYANTFIYSPEKQNIQMRIGTSGSFRAFLNDQLISECYDERNNDLDTYVSTATLQKGWNKMLLKVGYSDLEKCNFLLRITDDKGFPVKDLKYSTEKKEYKSEPGEKIVEIPSPYENYFKEKINQHPDYPENYVLLSEIYVRNEKLTEAEELLKNGLKKNPDNLVLMFQLLSVYNKDGKTTEMNTLSEKINNIRKDLPAIISIKMMDAVKNKNNDKARELTEKIIPLLPDSPELYLMKIGYYSLKNAAPKVIETINEAYEKYPDEWNIVTLKERLDYSVSRDYNKAVDIIEKFCKNNYSYTAYKELADLYLMLSMVDKWDSTYQKIIDQDPGAPGYHYQMAKVYYSLQKYEKAKSQTEEALHICPFSTTYYEMLGDIYAAQNNPDSARIAYGNSIKFSSTNYDAREKLKNLVENKPEDSIVKPFDIKALIAQSPSGDKYPGDDALILCNDVKRTFYEGGASEYDVEILVKLFTKDGIEHFTNYYIDYNSNVQDIIFDKAVVIKKDGSEIDADKNDGEVVFKSMDVNDCIYMKYKIRNYYTGALSSHFWDGFNFNLFFPIENIRYSLIMPSGINVYYRGQNMSSEPSVKKDIGGNTLYIWQKNDIPAVKYEAGMPPLNDVGKILYVSTIKDWNYIARWYLNLTGSKTIANYEIKEKVGELLQGKESLPVNDKIKIIYDYIVQNITYSSVPFRQSAFIPQKARDVLVTKIGDCKDMATLFITMLKVIGVNADYILVNTNDNGLNKNALPGNYFNHAIAKVEIDGKTVFFDLTARNYPAGTLPSMDIGAFALDITQGETSPFYIDGRNLYPREIIRDADATIRDDNSVTVNIKTKRTGSVTAEMRNTFSYINQTEQIKKMNEYLSESFSNFSVTNFTCGNLDSLTSTVSNSCSFTLNQYLGNAGDYKLLKMPWEDRVSSNAAFSYDQRKYAYNRQVDADLLKETLKIKLPSGYIPVEVPKDVSLDCKAASYKVEYKFSDGFVIAKRSMTNKSDVVYPQDYKDYKEFMNKVISSDLTQILLKKG